MMSRVFKYLRGFPKIFQPLNYSIKRRFTKRRDHEMDAEATTSTPTLHLPQITRSKSYYDKDNNILPSIRIRRARSLKPNNQSNSSVKPFSSESNLFAEEHSPNKTLDSLKYSQRKKSLSVSNNLNIIKNNSINNKSNYWDDHNVKASIKRKDKKEKPGSEIPRIVAEVIGEAASKSNRNQERVRLERQMVRIISGADPSTQSQVLLNTKTSQPWEDLVRDLGMAVRLPQSRRVGNRLETLYGRQVASYSQLRSQLKVGNNTFYIYTDMDEEDDYNSLMLPNLQRQRHSLTPEHASKNHRVKRSASNVSDRSRSKLSLAKTWSNSSSELSTKRSPSRHLNLPNNNDKLYDQNYQEKSRRRIKRRSHDHSPSPTFQLPPIHSTSTPGAEERYRRRSVSPGNYRTANYFETRSVHFQT